MTNIKKSNEPYLNFINQILYIFLFQVSIMQFFNIIVYSTQNVNFRDITKRIHKLSI